MSGPLKTFARYALLALVAAATLPALADPRGPGGYYGGAPHGGPHGGPYWHGYWGPRYGVPAHYPVPGRIVPVVPQSRVVVWGGVNYYWGGGIWYRPWGPSYVVVAPPLGIVVPILPTAYIVRPIGGVTYYVSNDVYYTANPAGPGYIVTAPPAGETYASQGVATSGDKVFVYPRSGQNADQEGRDRFDCHEWAVGQAGFDPTQPHSGNSEGRRSDYNRAFSACMDGRGYTVK